MIAGIVSAIFGGFIKLASTGMLNSILVWLGKNADDTAIATAAINAEIESRKAARDIRLATAGFFEMRLITFAIAFPFVVHLWAVAYDTITTGTRFEIHDWNVPAFPRPFDEWEGAILLSFFGLYGGLRIAQSLTGILAKWLR